MSIDQAVNLVRDALILTVVISAPILLLGLIVGIVISLFQAVTQIQEQTLTFIPKIVAMIAAAILLLPWMSQRMIEYSQVMFHLSPGR